MRIIYVFYFFIFTALLRLAIIFPIFHGTLFPTQRYDSHLYILKALEILQGNWLPIHTHAIGLPIFLAPFLYVWGASSIFENFLIGIIITAVAGAAIVFPLAWLAYRLTASKTAVMTTLVMFACAFPLIIPSTLFIFTESLFTLLFLISLCLLYKAQERPLFAYAASAIGGLGYWVRPNGIVILPILLISYLIMHKKIEVFRLLKIIILMVGIFFAVSGPMLYGRHIQFGSAFDYGENSKYFVEQYTDVWGAAPSVSLPQYITTHTSKDIFNRFFLTGLCLVLLYFAYNLLPGIFFFFYGAVLTWRDPTWTPIWIAIGIWIASLTPIFHLYYITRHLFPIAPLGMLVSIAGLNTIITLLPNFKKTLFYVFIGSQVAILCVSISVFLFTERRFTKDISRMTADSMIWAKWAATHVRGVLATGNGTNIMMLLPDTQVGGRGLQSLIAPISGLSITYPGKFKSLSEAMPILEMRGATHILLEDQVINPMLFVSDKYLSIYTGEDIPSYFKEIYSNYGTNSQSKVRILKIDWNEYKKKARQNGFTGN
jgi:hypothetical protein